MNRTKPKARTTQDDSGTKFTHEEIEKLSRGTSYS
jgi:hypothetical protein